VQYRDIPVLMYSTSNFEAHIGRARALGATGFITKPDSFLQIQRICSEIYTVSQQRDWARLSEIETAIAPKKK
jgi:CheY-like chemotaxis protein